MEVGKRVAVEGPIASEPTPDTPPASVIVTRTIRSGATAARFWDEWVEDMRDLASMYPGFIGLDQMPVREGSSRRTILYTFATPDTLDTWLQSPTRAESINRLKPHLVGETVQQQITGAEALHRRSAPKWKEVVAIVAVAIPVGRLVEFAVQHTSIGHLPAAAQIVGSGLLGVMAMTYLAVPASYRFFYRWLHR